jgi:predicted DNA-binding transcriptional regulator AlpA
MQPPFNDNLKNIAYSMGIALYQRFTMNEASLFLRCPVGDIKKLLRQGKVDHIRVTDSQIDFFGYQLLQYLLGTVNGEVMPPPSQSSPDRILRSKEVQEMTGLSRTTLWRLERKGEFPARVALCAGSVGWRLSEVELWLGNL